MDLGTGGWTEFKMTPDVVSYISDNIDLFGCETGLIHSHHTMGAFFSGQDTKTLQSEGNDTNCFVSLIVDTRGTYQAAITRKMQRKTEIVTRNLGKSYEFFGEGPVSDNLYDEESKEVADTVIEYFMLDVQREETNNPFDYLDARFEEIERQKKPVPTANSNSITVYNYQKGNTITVPKWNKDGSLAKTPGSDYDEDLKDTTFREWLNKPKDPEPKEQTLFSKDEMGEIDITKWQPDPTIIHYLACQLASCSLIVNKDLDLKQWIVRHMEKKYDEIFSSVNGLEFETWADNYVEFIISHYSDEKVPEEVYDDWDLYSSKIASALADELGEYPENPYLANYIELLLNRVYE